MKRTRQLLLVLGVFVMMLGRDLGGVRAAEGEEGEEEEEYDDVEEEEVDDSRALLVVWKRLKEDTVVEGKEVVVEITVYNMGTSTAGDVHVRDSFPEDMFTLKDGATKFRVDKLSAGSDETFQYTLMPKSSGSSDLGHAKVTYLPSTDGSPEKQIAKSTVATALVLTTQDYIIRSILLAGSYATLGAFKTAGQWQRFGVFFFVLIALMGGNWAWNSVNAARTAQRRRKALDALEKDE